MKYLFFCRSFPSPRGIAFALFFLRMLIRLLCVREGPRGLLCRDHFENPTISGTTDPCACSHTRTRLSLVSYWTSYGRRWRRTCRICKTASGRSLAAATRCEVLIFLPVLPFPRGIAFALFFLRMLIRLLCVREGPRGLLCRDHFENPTIRVQIPV